MFQLIIDLIDALSRLLWPILGFVIFFSLKNHIVKMLPYVKKIKIAGQEIEFDKAIDEFQESVEKSTQEIPERVEKNDRDENEIIRSASKDPKMGIVILGKEIEKEIRELFATLGMLNDNNYVSSQQALNIMIQKGYIPKHTASSLEIFENLRNAIVHGQDSGSDKDIIRVLDIGMTLLQTLKSIPHEKNIVYKADVDLYSDRECKNLVPDAKGIMLETISSGGVEKNYRIYPSTRIGYYKKGKEVSWEWDLRKTWLDTWYIDPRSKEIKQAWNSSGNFVGRHLDELEAI